MFHKFGVGHLFKWVVASHPMEKKRWKLGRRKVIEGFAMSRLGVRNENKA